MRGFYDRKRRPLGPPSMRRAFRPPLRRLLLREGGGATAGGASDMGNSEHVVARAFLRARARHVEARERESARARGYRQTSMVCIVS